MFGILAIPFVIIYENDQKSHILKDAKKLCHIECKKRAKGAVAIASAEAQEKIYQDLVSPEGQKLLSDDQSERKEKEDDNGRVLTKNEEIKGRW